jgi:hypothetical protein
MQLSNSLTPRSIASSNYLLRQYGGAAAAYSLQRLDTSVENVVRARRSTDDAEADFTAQEVSGGSLRHFALNNDADLIRFADQAVAADERMYFDGVNDEVRVTGMTASVDYFGACTIEATIYVEDTTATQVVWSLGSDCYRLVSISGQWRLNGATDTSVLVTSGLITIAVDYDASGQATELRIGGATAWTGTAPAGTTPTTIFYLGSRASGLFFKGLLYDFSITGSSVKNFAFNGYGNTDADWEDQVGSNDGTVIGTPALFSGQGFDAYVTTLYDQSGNGRDATQATSASQPQIVADGVVVTDGNGNPAVQFDGTDDWLDHSYNATLTSQSHFFVSQIESGAGADTRMYAMAVGTAADVNSADLHIPAIKNSSLQRIAVFDGVAIGASNITYGSPFLWTVLHSGSLISPYLDGNAAGTSARTLNASVTRQFIGAGCNTGTGPFLYCECTMAELIIYDNLDQSSNRAAIEANIASRYGIVI